LTVGKEAVLKQSNNQYYKGQVAALLLRISRDDGEEGDSNSIQTQKKLLEKVAREKGYSELLVFSDDGVTGTTMKRPGFQAMVKEIERGNIGAVFVKDLSRLGRNYREVGYYMEEFFPEHDVRLVAVSDGVDSAEGEDELAPFRNIMNEWYAKDISKKRRISNKVKGGSGEPLSPPPYGYLKDPDNPKRWIVDEEAAATVRRIFDLTLQGHGIGQIARILSEDKVLTPSSYWSVKGISRPSVKKGEVRVSSEWRHSTVQKILNLQEYCGDVINFKTYQKSFHQKKRLVTPEEDRAIFKDVNAAIVSRATWEKVQNKKRRVRKRTTDDGGKSIFSGKLICADCGGNLNLHYNQKNRSIRYFNCANNNTLHKTCDTTHYIRLDYLEQVVLGELQRLMAYAQHYEDAFLRAVIGNSQVELEREKQAKEKELQSLTARDKELDGIYERLYEDICCKGRKSNPSNTEKAAGSSVAV